MIPGPGPYVRALIVCGAVADEDAEGGTDIRGARTRLGLPSDSTSVKIDLEVFIAIERNGDHGKHAFRLRLVDPTGAEVTRMQGEIELPEQESMIIPTAFPLRLAAWRPGRYRLLLEFGDRIAAFAPLDLEPVDPGDLGLPRPELD